MDAHTHSCSNEIIDTDPNQTGVRVFKCVFHLIFGVAVGLVAFGALAVIGALG